MDDPSSNGGNGQVRDSNGRFVRGNPGGPGNPKARDVARMREVFRSACSDADLRALAKKLVAMGKRGNVLAAREVLNRVLGKVPIVLEQKEESEPVLPVIEVVVENHDEFIEFSRIQNAMMAQIGEKRKNAPLMALPSPDDERGEDDSADGEVD